MKAAGPRRQRILALLASCLISAAAVGTLAGGVAAGQVPCVVDPDNPCPTTTTEPETTTTEEAPPVTEAPPTTQAETATSLEQPVTTEEIDEVSELTTTSLGVTTSSNLLVPGDGTEGAESTTTSTTLVSATVDDGGISDGTLIALVIGGLVTMAILVGFLTWRYWVATQPPALPGP